MENEQKNSASGAVNKKARSLKAALIFLGASVVFLFLTGYGLSKYDEWSFKREIKRLTEEANRPYLEDTYGGKTPKETLELFISAVEKGDFDLASKYFVLSKQEEWRRRLVEGREKNNLDNLLKLIDDEMVILNDANPLWEVDDHYISTNKVLFEFIKYPRGIWKIKEI